MVKRKMLWLAFAVLSVGVFWNVIPSTPVLAETENVGYPTGLSSEYVAYHNEESRETFLVLNTRTGDVEAYRINRSVRDTDSGRVDGSYQLVQLPKVYGSQ